MVKWIRGVSMTFRQWLRQGYVQVCLALIVASFWYQSEGYPRGYVRAFALFTIIVLSLRDLTERSRELPGGKESEDRAPDDGG